jgi:hypothetical protein
LACVASSEGTLLVTLKGEILGSDKISGSFGVFFLPRLLIPKITIAAQAMTTATIIMPVMVRGSRGNNQFPLYLHCSLSIYKSFKGVSRRFLHGRTEYFR